MNYPKIVHSLNILSLTFPENCAQKVRDWSGTTICIKVVQNQSLRYPFLFWFTLKLFRQTCETIGEMVREAAVKKQSFYGQADCEEMFHKKKKLLFLWILSKLPLFDHFVTEQQQ